MSTEFNNQLELSLTAGKLTMRAVASTCFAIAVVTTASTIKSEENKGAAFHQGTDPGTLDLLIS